MAYYLNGDLEIVLQAGDTLSLVELSAKLQTVLGGGGIVYTAKGDIPVGTGPGTALALGVGSDGQTLVADSAQALGMRWATGSGTGDVVGPASSATDDVALFSSGTGKALKTAGMSLSAPTTAHVAAADPHPQYAMDTDLAAHVAAANPHTVYQLGASKDASGGYAGLTLYSINFKNVAGSFTSYLTNNNSASRIATFPDKDITVAGIVDITKVNVGLGNCDNTADVNKSVATAANGVLWNGAAKSSGTAAPSGGANGDIYFQYV